MENETKEQVIIINPREQIQTLINAGKLAKDATAYRKENSTTIILVNEGNEGAPPNPTLIEYLRRAEKEIIERNMEEIIKEAESMIQDELTNIRELLK